MTDAIWPGSVDVADPFAEPTPACPGHPELVRAIAELWAGRADPDDVARRMGRLGLDGPLVASREPEHVGPWLAPEADLVRITTDADPAAGAAAPDLVLGPLADEADPRALEVAVALGAFFQGDGVDATPARRWSRGKPVPSRPERAAVRAIAKAPLAPWRVLALSPGRCELADVVGLGEAAPRGPVVLRTPAQPLGPLRAGDLLIARVARGPRGWEATCPIALPLRDLPAAVPTWLRWLAWSDRLERAGRPPTLGGLLARRGHVLARRLLEQAWVA